MEISIKKEDLQTKSLFVATPMYGGVNHGLYMKACLDLQGMCMQYGIQIKFSFLFNESLITELATIWLTSLFTVPIARICCSSIRMFILIHKMLSHC